MASSRPIAQCAKCGKRCTDREFLVLVSSTTPPSDDIGRLKAYCEKCYCAVGIDAKRRWAEAMRDRGPCTCKFIRHQLMPDELVGPPCETCTDQDWHLTNFRTFLRELRGSQAWRPALGLRAYNKLGRCVCWTD
jgi:hypothetical protein